MLALIVRVVLSWFPAPTSPGLRQAYEVLFEITEPVLGLFRRLMPASISGGAGIDFSPIIAVLVLNLGYEVIVRPVLLSLLVAIL